MLQIPKPLGAYLAKDPAGLPPTHPFTRRPLHKEYSLGSEGIVPRGILTSTRIAPFKMIVLLCKMIAQKNVQGGYASEHK